jgi:hypothetical protein
MTKEISWPLQIHCKKCSLYLIDKIFLFLNIKGNINELNHKKRIILIMLLYFIMYCKI